MKNINPIEDIVIIYPKDDNGEEIKFRFIMALKKRISEPIVNAIVRVSGVDNVGMIGQYTIEISIARTFNPDEVTEAIRETVQDFLSDIITPKLAIPQ